MVKTKRAIAMIELIFALVIMGIVLMSAPMLIQQSIKSSNVALQQEAIAAAASQSSIVLSMHWDEENANLPVGVSPILNTGRAPFDFNASVPFGLVGVSSRNSKDGNSTISPTLFASFGTDETNNSDTNESDYSDFDDVDDYNGQTLGLYIFNSETTTSDIGDYVDVNISIATTITYTEDRVDTNVLTLTGTDINLSSQIDTSLAGNPITNIKFVNVNLTSNSGIEELDKNITFKAFSCNIGTYIPEDRGEL